MIIVSQDKDTIINHDNVQLLWINKNILNKTNKTFYIYADHDFLGEYKTEERAKEVLQELWQFYETVERYKSSNGMAIVFEKRYAYEMPED